MLNKNYFIKILIIFSNFILPCLQTSHEYELTSVSVVFRHGDRTPTEVYENEVYTEKDYYPVPLGGLTNNGKKREYDLGKLLRTRYDEFLGNVYVPSDVYTRCTEYERTQMSLLLVLAGLYPPVKQQRWDTFLNWQPIPVRIVPLEKDQFLPLINCPKYINELNRIMHDPTVTKDLNQNSDFKKKIQNFTGLENPTVLDVSRVYSHFQSQEAMGLKLPEWVNPYYPKGLLEAFTITAYKTFNYNKLLTKFNAGLIFKIILDNLSTMNEDQRTKKIFLYSGHDVTIISLLSALKLWKSYIPNYSSAIILEKWKQNSNFYIKVLQYKGIPKEVKALTIPNCTEMCPLKHLENILSHLLSDNNGLKC